jgi:hypothetical protein
MEARMPSDKKKEQTFKLDYFDIVKGVLFPNRGSSKPKAVVSKPVAAAVAPVEQTPPVATAPVAEKKVSSGAFKVPKVIYGGKMLPAFWTVTTVLSLIVNIILIVVLVIVGQQLFAIKQLVNGHLLGGLYENFILMDQAHIKTDITVKDTIPIKFDLPISKDTVVVLNQDTAIDHVLVQINTGALSINSYARIVLPAQTNLPIHLDLLVPVEAQIPVTLNVPVDIPLAKTELHKPFVGLQDVVSPLYWLLQPQIKNANNIPACQNGLGSWFCQKFFK